MSAYELPMSISTDTHVYPITNNGDFRMVLDCFSALGDAELTVQERIISCLIIFYSEFEDVDDVLQ